MIKTESTDFEGIKFEIVEITPDNVDLLTSIREEVDEEDPGRLKREVKRYADDSERKAFVIKDGDSVVGYVEVNRSETLPENAPGLDDLENLAHLSRIGVSEDYRRQDLGSKLLKTAEDWAIKNRRTGIWLDYLDGSDARDFYVYNDYKIRPIPFEGAKDKLHWIAVKRFN